MTRVAFAGAGKMGAGMISSLLRAGHEVAVYNRTPEKIDRLLGQGATSARTPAEATDGAEVVFSMVMDDTASRGVWLGPSGVLSASLRPDVVLVECSTLSHSWVSEFHRTAAQRGISSLDCPVAGRPDAAAAGRLDVFVGGSPQDLKRVSLLLTAFGRSITHFGPAGSGIAFKLIYNMVSAIQLASLAEAMAACRSVGVDLAAAAKVFAEGSTGSPNIKHHVPLMASGAYLVPPPFTAQGRLKDLTYAINLLDQFGATAQVATSVSNLYRLMVDSGGGALSDTELMDVLCGRNGRT